MVDNARAVTTAEKRMAMGNLRGERCTHGDAFLVRDAHAPGVTSLSTVRVVALRLPHFVVATNVSRAAGVRATLSARSRLRVDGVRGGGVMSIRKFRLGHAPRISTDGRVVPTDIAVREDGSAVASFDGEPLLRYDSLDELLTRYGLSSEDLREREP